MIEIDVLVYAKYIELRYIFSLVPEKRESIFNIIGLSYISIDSQYCK